MEGGEGEPFVVARVGVEEGRRLEVVPAREGGELEEGHRGISFLLPVERLGEGGPRRPISGAGGIGDETPDTVEGRPQAPEALGRRDASRPRPIGE